MKILFCLPALLALVTIVSAAPANQQQVLPANLPPIVKDAVDRNNKDCEADEKPVYQRGFLTIRDINGDGKPDYILNYDHFLCGDRAGMFCGTGGCQTEIFASEDEKGYVQVWDKLARKVTFLTLNKRPAMRIDIHGTLCGRNGSERCTLTLYWNGSEFHPAN